MMGNPPPGQQRRLLRDNNNLQGKHLSPAHAGQRTAHAYQRLSGGWVGNGYQDPILGFDPRPRLLAEYSHAITGGDHPSPGVAHIEHSSRQEPTASNNQDISRQRRQQEETHSNSQAGNQGGKWQYHTALRRQMTGTEEDGGDVDQDHYAQKTQADQPRQQKAVTVQ